MKKMVLLAIVILALSTAAFAAEPLAYEDAKMIGVDVQRNVMDTSLGMLKGNSYGAKLSYSSVDSGVAAHVTVSDAHMKGGAEAFGNDITGGSPSVTAEISKRFDKVLGVYAKYQRFFGEMKGQSQGSYDSYDENGNVYDTYFWNDQTSLSNLQIMEAGLLGQKDFEKLHIYAGPMLQVVKADLSYSYSEDGYGGWNDKTDVVAKSGLGAVAGVAYNFGKMTAKASATFKEHATYGTSLQYSFK